jgi:2-methylcitrate dehydratase
MESKEIATSGNVGYITKTGPGWKNTSGRAWGNGPMDECSRRFVEWVDKFSEKDLTDATIDAANYGILDSMAALVGGFEEEPSRINARLAQTMPGNSTMLGYGIKTTYEMAAFGNGCMFRHTDFNPGAHYSEMWGGVLAVAEPMKATGLQMLTAMAITYEVVTAMGNTGEGNYDPGGFDSPYHAMAVALACGKLMGLNKDQLGNALSLALVPHMPLYVCHIGIQSMWKGCHSSEQVRNGVWAAMLAQAGMTGPPEPFESRDGLIQHIGPFARDLVLPARSDGRLALETLFSTGLGYKRFASEGTTQVLHGSIIPPLHEWAKPEEIASIDMENTYYSWQEISDPPKWDPQNRETADHSMPYNIARGIVDGHIYLDSFGKAKRDDPRVRELMDKITIWPNMDPTAQVSLTVTKKSGEVRKFVGERAKPMSHDDVIAKWNKACDLKEVNKEQRDRARELWTNLAKCKDINEPIQTLAKYGNPQSLSDRRPTSVS